MRVYTVHVRTPTERLDRDVILIREGFNWYAFLFAGLWALWSRLWLVAAGLIALELVWAAIATRFDVDPLFQAATSFGLALIVGWAANDLRRWTLFRRGYTEVGVVAARDDDQAMQRFFDQHALLAAGLVR
jgi:Protein of unknown function (DUF2628).